MCFTIHPTDDDRTYFGRGKPIEDNKVRLRILVERLIIREAVKMLCAKGYGLQLVEAGGSLTPLTRQWQVIMNALMATDEECVHVYRWVEAVPKHVGTIYFVYGNDGHDVISDISLWLDAELEAVNRLADKLSDSHVVEAGV